MYTHTQIQRHDIHICKSDATSTTTRRKTQMRVNSLAEAEKGGKKERRKAEKRVDDALNVNSSASRDLYSYIVLCMSIYGHI